MGAIFGVKNQPLFGQAVAFYRWINAVLCACKKPCLIVKMDEASLTYELTGIVGTVLKSRPSMGWEPGQRVRLGDRRGNVTYIASISNDEEVNKILPQILLGNSHRFSKRLVKDAEAAVGDRLSYGVKIVLGTTITSCRNTYASCVAVVVSTWTTEK